MLWWHVKEEIKYLVSLGLKGIEIVHSKSNNEQREYYKELASEFNLLTTGGTDYHGPEVKPNIEFVTRISININVTRENISSPDLVPSSY